MFDRDRVYSDAMLTQTEIEFVELCLGEPREIDGFSESSACEKLQDYYADEMPIDVAMCNTGEPDVWILEKLEQCS